MAYLAVRKKNRDHIWLVEIVDGKRVVRKVQYQQHIYDYLGYADKRASTHEIHHDVYGQPCVRRYIDNGTTSKERDRLYEANLGKKDGIYCGDVDLKYQFLSDHFPGEVTYRPDDYVRAYLDIETSMTSYPSAHAVRVRRKDGTSEVDCLVEDLWKIRETHDVFDETIHSWTTVMKSCYLRTSGFPDVWQAEKEILSIAVVLSGSGDKYVFGLKDYPGEPEGFRYMKFDSEVSMLKHFWIMLEKRNVSILCHWNGDNFDMPYLVMRSKNLMGLDERGYEVVKKYFPTKHYFQRPHKLCPKPGTVYIPGWISYDLMNLYKKFEQVREESYALDAIGKKLLGEGKVDYHSEYRNLTELYNEDFKKFVDYNLRDVTLMVEIDEKKKHVDLAMKIAYMMKILPDDIYSNTKAWDIKIYNLFKSKGIVVPKSIDGEKPEEEMTAEELVEHVKKSQEEKYAGGFVSEVRRGKHSDVVVYDVNSLYPNIMIALNTTPWTYIGNELPELKTKDEREKRVTGFVEQPGILESKTHDLNVRGCAMSPSGAVFQIEKQDSVMAIAEEMFHRRIFLRKKSDKIKKESGETDETEVLDLEVQAIKIVLNSLYGAFGAKYFRYYRREIAEAITLAGQYLIQRIGRDIEKKLDDVSPGKKSDRVIYIDTDSNFISLHDMIDVCYEQSGRRRDRRQTADWIEQICERYIDGTIVESFASATKTLNVLKNTFKMSREKICDGAIFFTKKRYGLLLSQKDGKFLEQPKTEYKGVEVVRSDTPAVIRKYLREFLDYLLPPDSTSEMAAKKVQAFREYYDTLTVEQIARPMSVRDMEKYNPEKTFVGKPGFYEPTDGINFMKRTPVHVKAAWLYNDFLKRHGYDADYPLIYSHDKLRWVYLHAPNSITQNHEVVGFVDKYGFPGTGEYDIKQWVNRDKQFETTFYNKIDKICRSIGWDLGAEIKKANWIQL